VIRVSLAPETEEADIARFLETWARLKARRAAA
jgi:selenocysteine lyase/cysteine desulfurase